MPCGRRKTPSPQERRNVPSRSNTMTGCSPRLNTWTRSRPSTATLVASTNDQPSGSLPQPSTARNGIARLPESSRRSYVVIPGDARIGTRSSDSTAGKNRKGRRVRYGFVIDQRKCIGCHACTVACKEENQVPLGAFRTWVKYVERGRYPDTRRYFSVLRCNHCDDAPCVTICPTVALYRRPDGIVDFDGERCIGCKSCMQGCPYDALYIDPATDTAAKCNYCAHRIEVGLEPACVIVCPERAIVAGDLDDPAAPIARLVATEQVQVRKPEQGTRPKLFYVGADAAALTPSLQAPAESYV